MLCVHGELSSMDGRQTPPILLRLRWVPSAMQCFGYSQGIIAPAWIQPLFIRRMYGKHMVYCAGTTPMMFFVDTWGRKKLLLTGSVGLVFALALVGGPQYHTDTLPAGPARMPTADWIFTGS